VLLTVRSWPVWSKQAAPSLASSLPRPERNSSPEFGPPPTVMSGCSLGASDQPDCFKVTAPRLPQLAARRHMRLCLYVDGPARAGEKGMPCVPAGPIGSGNKSAAAPATVSGEATGPSAHCGQATEPNGLGRQVRGCRSDAPTIASQDTCHRRASHAARRGALEAGDSPCRFRSTGCGPR
jgi:hypothetical protein